MYKRYSNEPSTNRWGTPSLSGRTEEVNQQSELTRNDPYDKTEATQGLFLLYLTWIEVLVTRSYDRRCRRLLIGPAARERRIVYYRLISVYHFEHIEALSHNCGVS